MRLAIDGPAAAGSGVLVFDGPAARGRLLRADQPAGAAPAQQRQQRRRHERRLVVVGAAVAQSLHVQQRLVVGVVVFVVAQGPPTFCMSRQSVSSRFCFFSGVRCSYTSVTALVTRWSVLFVYFWAWAAG